MPGGDPPTLTDWCLKSLSGPIGRSFDPEVDLSMLTVVVPSFNRQDYLLRQIRFWASSSARLIIVDGSTLPIDGRIRSAVDAHPGIEYLHHPGGFVERVSLAGGLIETPYAVLLGDDEFHLETGLAAALEVLEGEGDLVGCMGQVLSFSPVGAYRRIVFARAYSSLQGYQVRHDQPQDRLIAAMSEYTMAACYAVLRTPIWRRSWGTIGNWESAHACEMQQAMAVHLLGGLTTTNHIQWLRSIENSPVGNTSEDGGAGVSADQSTGIWFPEWWESPPYETERRAFVTMLTEAVSENLGVRGDECSQWVSAGAQTFVAGHRGQFDFDVTSHGIAARLRPLVASFLRKIARQFPDRIFLGAKRLRGSVLRTLGRPGGDYYGTVNDLPKVLESEGVRLTSAAAEELSFVETMVREFHTIRDEEILSNRFG